MVADASTPLRTFVGARGGVFHNFARVSSPLPMLEIAARRGRLQGSLQVGHYTARLAGSDAGIRVRSELLAVPAAATLAWAQPAGRGTVTAGGGVSATWFRTKVEASGQPSTRAERLAPGVQVLAGYAHPIGRGVELSAEAAWCLGSTEDGAAVETSPSGLSGTLGIRVPLGGGAP